MHFGRLAFLVFAVGIGFSTLAHAQEPADAPATRRGGLAAARAAKAEDLSPPRRPLIERALHWYDNHDARLAWRGIRFSGGGFPAGAGLGFGVGVSRRAIGSAIVDPDQPNRLDADVVAARSTRGYQRAAARVELLNVGGIPLDVILRGQDYRLPQEDFFGLGPNSPHDGRTNYRLDGREVDVAVRWRPFGGAAIDAGVAHLTPTVGAGTDRRFADTTTVFDAATLPGLDEMPEFVRSDLSAAYDWRDSATHPRRGGYYRARLSSYDDRTFDGFDFRRLEVDLQQVVPLPNAYRRIELRAAAVATDAMAGDRVPFIFQPTLGGQHRLRGFRESRFRDRNAVSVSAEYQWEAWWALDAAVFVDAGQVTARFRDLSARTVEVTYGVGFRLHTNTAFLARLDLAVSREGFVPLLGFSYGY